MMTTTKHYRTPASCVGPAHPSPRQGVVPHAFVSDPIARSEAVHISATAVKKT